MTPETAPKAPPKSTPIDLSAEVSALAADLAEASDVRDPKARAHLAHTLAEQMIRHRLITERDLRGELSPEVGRTVPAVARQIRDLARELGVTERKRASGGLSGGFMGGEGPEAPATASASPGGPSARAKGPAPKKRGRPRKSARLEPVDPVGDDEDEDKG